MRTEEFPAGIMRFPHHGDRSTLPKVSPVQMIIRALGDRMPIRSTATEELVVGDLQRLQEQDSLIGRMAQARVFYPGGRKDTIEGQITQAEFTESGVRLNFDVRSGTGYLVLDGSGAYNRGYSVNLTLEE